MTGPWDPRTGDAKSRASMDFLGQPHELAGSRCWRFGQALVCVGFRVAGLVKSASGPRECIPGAALATTQMECAMSRLNLSETFQLTPKERKRFFSRIELRDDGCLVWTGAKNPKGYGRIGVRGTMPRCHRLAWTIKNGPIPVGACVLHTCDVPACVNPDHLFLGTFQDNNTDKARKGRGTKSKKGLPFGVHLHGRKFQAQATENGVNHRLGTFDTAEEASAVAQEFKAAYLLSLETGRPAGGRER